MPTITDEVLQVHSGSSDGTSCQFLHRLSPCDDEWDAEGADGDCRSLPTDKGEERDNSPLLHETMESLRAIIKFMKLVSQSFASRPIRASVLKTPTICPTLWDPLLP